MWMANSLYALFIFALKTMLMVFLVLILKPHCQPFCNVDYLFLESDAGCFDALPTASHHTVISKFNHSSSVSQDYWMSFTSIRKII